MVRENFGQNYVIDGALGTDEDTIGAFYLPLEKRLEEHRKLCEATGDRIRKSNIQYQKEIDEGIREDPKYRQGKIIPFGEIRQREQG